jgi:hypothetical protein
MAIVKFGGDAQDLLAKRAFTVEAFSASSRLKEHFEKFGKMPATPQEAGVAPHYEVNWDLHDTNGTNMFRLTHDISVDQDSILVVFTGISEVGPVTLIIRPVSDTVPVSWDCTGGTLEDEYRPEKCRKRLGN